MPAQKRTSENEKQKYHAVGTGSNTNSKIIEIEKKSMYITDHLSPWLGTDTSMKSGKVKHML